MNCEVMPLSYDLLRRMGLNDDEYKFAVSKGIAFAMVVEGKPVAAGGITPVPGRDRVGHAWTIQVQDAAKSPFLMRRVHAYCVRLWPMAREALHLDRVEAETSPDGPHCRWLERFGFTNEGPARKYYQGKTWMRYAWIRED